MSIFKEYSRNFVNQMKLQEVDPNLTQKHNKDYNWTKDYDFLRYLAYYITKKAFDQGIYDNRQNLDIVRHVADMVGQEISQLVSLYDPTHLKFRREDIEKMQQIDSDTVEQQYSSLFTDPTVQDVIKVVMTKLKDINSSEGEGSNLLVDELPADWEDKYKKLWVTARMAKYVASILPVHPWRVFLVKGNEDDVDSDANHFLDSHGWAVFRSEDAAQRAFEAFLSDKTPELQQAYRQNSTTPIEFSSKDAYPEMDMLLELINKNLDKLGLSEPLTRQDVEATRKIQLSEEPYQNEKLNKRLNQVVIPALKSYATEVQKYYYEHASELPKQVLPTEEVTND